MRDHVRASNQILTQIHGLPAHLTPCSGSSESTTYLLRCYAKIGPTIDVLQEYEAYQRLASAAGAQASWMLPLVTAPRTLDDNQGLLFIEPVQGQSLEAAVFAYGEAEGEVRAQHGRSVEKMIQHALQHLDCIRQGSLSGSERHTRDFVTELVAALRENVNRGGYDGSAFDLSRVIDGNWSQESVGESHRDLSVVNIIGNDVGVRFIDPRLAVPNITQGARLASPALDLVTLAVSLERKQLELQCIEPGCLVPGVALVNHQLATLESQGSFSRRMRQLCEATVRSVYVACRCDYCTAPSRAWLYEHMVETMRQSISQLSPS